ncbi:3'(2'),5'-bisphosphate nucleotidase CysQ family protein [Phaeodactylibacter xiamenensis]|uniref:3'(2'),5'-bisphosphate nucleotidase CysQ family protein n=1 Tax=Phaeodactylibacter xiamenensis TaxID=1524460 RepID=UPI003BA9E2C3
MNLSQLTQVATEAAIAAGQVIQKAIGEEVPVEEKQGGESYASQVVTAVDKAAEAVILSHLLPTCEAFGLALLSEETEDDGSRFEKDFFWCIDPMDGTLPFIRKQPGFSVSIALVDKGGTPHLGVVADPSTNTLYHAIRGEGAWKNNKPWTIQNTNNHLTYVTDRPLKDTPRADDIRQFLRQQVEKLGLSGVREWAGGGAVLNAIRVLENGPACMLKFPKKEQGGGSIWDFAATSCIFQEADRPATSFNGNPLDLNRQGSTFMNHEGVLYLNL